MKAADEGLILVVVFKPIDIVAAKDTLDERIGLVAVLLIEETGFPADGQTIISFETEPIAIDLEGGGEMGRIYRFDIVVHGPIEVCLPEFKVVEEPMTDFGNTFFMRGGNAPLVVLNGKGILRITAGKLRIAFKMTGPILTEDQLHLFPGYGVDVINISGMFLIGKVKLAFLIGPAAKFKPAEVLGIGAVRPQFYKAACVQQAVPFRMGPVGIVIKP